ncbi:hypothetical protein M433DRAFT_150347 [Acidomyces richmondensis BFW]|nr:MAG: hypothetical protein FE78DRAFT_92898 [Acidomyces sp. 'richmondensis']KYG49176.1 hypothetical protein M433DRAFT_150347 [Acidomyces richmondensis BFW]
MVSEGVKDEHRFQHQQPPPSDNQDMATEDSRTRAVGRKRKQASTQDVSTTDKRRKTVVGDADSSDGEDNVVASRVVSRRGSRESGEVSTSCSSRRTSNESSENLPSKRSVAPSDPITSLIAPIGHDSNVAKTQGRVMDILDVKPLSFQKHIADELSKAGNQSVEDLVRSCCRHGMPFRSYAVALIREWDKTTSGVTSGISVPTAWQGNSSALDIRMLEVILTNGQFCREMTWDDLGTYHEHYNQVIERLKEKACQLGRPDDVVGMLIDWFKRGGPSKAARKRIDKYIDDNYIGAKQVGSVTGGTHAKPGEQQNENDGVEREVRVEDSEHCYAARGSANSSREHSVANTSSPIHARANDEVSVGDRADRDYGSLARAAASVQTNGASETDLWIRLCDIPESEQILQYRYFGLIDGCTYVRCLICGREGHMQDTCPERICAHCGVANVHFSSACPKFRKCRLCRRRGHLARECRNPSVQGGGPGDPCDVCGEIGHIEEECSDLWRFYQIQDKDIVKAKTMITACYNCGRMDHWGDDCPKLPSFLKDVRSNNRTWSKKHADRFLEKSSSQWPGKEGEGIVNGSGRYNYQLAHLDDIRD